MAEAEEELVAEYPNLANEIREERKKLEADRGYFPDYLGLIKLIDQKCEKCTVGYPANNKQRGLEQLLPNSSE